MPEPTVTTLSREIIDKIVAESHEEVSARHARRDSTVLYQVGLRLMCREFNHSVMRVGLPTLSVDETQVITTWDTLRAYPAASNMHKFLHNARELVVHSSYAYLKEGPMSTSDEDIAEYDLVHGADTFQKLLRIIQAVPFRTFTFERNFSFEQQSAIVALILPKRIHELRLGTSDDHEHIYFTTSFHGHAWMPLFTAPDTAIQSFAMIRTCNDDGGSFSGEQRRIAATLKNLYVEDHWHFGRPGDFTSEVDPFLGALAASVALETFTINFELPDDWSGGAFRDIDLSPVSDYLTHIYVDADATVSLESIEHKSFPALRSMVIAERSEEEASHLMHLPQNLETLHISSCLHSMSDFYARMSSLVKECQAPMLREMCIEWTRCEVHSDCKLAQGTGYCPWPMRRGCGLDFGIELDVIDATRYRSSPRTYHLTA